MIIRNFSLEDVHVEGTERIVEAVCKYDVDRYIHVSSHSANSQSVSEFYRTKVCGSSAWLMEGNANKRLRVELRRLPDNFSLRPLLSDLRPSSVSRTTCC